jgi:LmbE family N-acetylglucosaminyl deacetylase
MNTRRDVLRYLTLAGWIAPLRAQTSEVTIERGGDRKGQVLALITPHLDDGPIFAGGTIAKLLAEGCKGYFIRTSNDEKDSLDLSMGETVLANERDTKSFVETIGLERSFDLGYRNHRMDDVPRTEIRARLIFLFRLLKVNIVFSYDPYGHYEENPDHTVTAQSVEAACWMAGGRLDYPEHFAAGLKPHSVAEKYYFARGPQLVNRAVDIAPVMDKKIRAIRSCRTMMKHMSGDLNAALAEQQLRVETLQGDGGVDEFIRVAFQERDRRTGARYGLDYAEEFHYVGPDKSLEPYLKKNARPL